MLWLHIFKHIEMRMNLRVAVEFRISREKKRNSTFLWERIDSGDTSSSIRWRTTNKSILRSCFMDAKTISPPFLSSLDPSTQFSVRIAALARWLCLITSGERIALCSCLLNLVFVTSQCLSWLHHQMSHQHQHYCQV